MRQLKHHEQKLLKKVDFLNVSWDVLVSDSADVFGSGSKMHHFERSR
jgi:hypothetical protein